MSIGTNIKLRRFELGMSQQELALAMGYKTRSTIAKIESGENSITIKKLEQFATVLDTSIDNLVRGSHNIYNAEGSNTSNNIAIILAGGKSSRNQQNIPNQFISILGKPVIIYACEAYQHHPMISEIQIVCLKGWEEIVKSYAEEFGITKLTKIITGSETGILSVKNAIDSLIDNNNKTVILQEATRPFVSEETISKVLNQAKNNHIAVSCKKMDEYMQFLDYGTSSKSLDRSRVLSVQSPEAYSLSLLKSAFSKAEKNNHNFNESFTAMFLHNLGYRLNFCESNYNNNIKIVRQEDIAIATALLKNK